MMQLILKLQILCNNHLESGKTLLTSQNAAEKITLAKLHELWISWTWLVHSSKQFQLLEHHPNKMCIIPIGPTQQLKVKQLST
jgi:hypothetical protein